MVRQVIDVGEAPDDGTGDPLRTSQIKVNENFEELYQVLTLDDDLIIGRSQALTQVPAGVDTPLQVEFGPAQNSPEGEISLNADGSILINEEGSYFFSAYLNTGRVGANGTSRLFGRVLVSGVQPFSPVATLLDDAEVSIPQQFDFFTTLPQGAIVTFELYRDSTGNDSGELRQFTPTLGDWGVSPSASIIVRRARSTVDLIPETRENYRLIKTVDDFPQPVAGVITLDTDFDYEINGAVNITPNRIQLNGSHRIFGLNPTKDLLITDNAGALFTGSDDGLISESLAITNPSGTLFDMENTVGNEKTKSLILDGVVTVNSNGLGRISNLLLFTSNQLALRQMRDGMVSEGTIGVLEVIGSIVENGTTTTNAILDMGTSVIEIANISGNGLQVDDNIVFLKGLVDSGNIAANGQGNVLDNVSTGGGTVSSINIGPLDDRWLFNGNNTIPDTPFAANIYMQNNTTPTVITNGAPVKIAGVTVASLESRFEMDQDNRITYTGVKTIFAKVSVIVNGQRTSGTAARLYNFVVYKNGVAVDGSLIETELRGDILSNALTTTVVLNENDYIEAWVVGIGHNDNIIIDNLQMVINKV